MIPFLILGLFAPHIVLLCELVYISGRFSHLFDWLVLHICFFCIICVTPILRRGHETVEKARGEFELGASFVIRMLRGQCLARMSQPGLPLLGML